MPKPKRIRIFAGPNGSGKTTLANQLILNGEFKASAFVNADEIEKELRNNSFVDFGQYGLTANKSALIKYVSETGMSLQKLKDDRILNKFKVRENKISFNGQINSYIAADLAGFMREVLMGDGKDFWFETVFSHKSKLEIMQKAKSLGYRVYFYFIATDSPDININRVSNRVAKLGHSVPEDKIRSRYYRSLQLSLDAIKASDRAYLFDNSQKALSLIAEVENGNFVKMRTNEIPKWFVDYIYKP